MAPGFLVPADMYLPYGTNSLNFVSNFCAFLHARANSSDGMHQMYLYTIAFLYRYCFGGSKVYL